MRGPREARGAAAARRWRAAAGQRRGKEEGHRRLVPRTAKRVERLSDRRRPIRPEEEAADLLPQLCRDVVPVPDPVAGQHHHPDVAANPGVEQKVPRPRPGPHGVVDEPARGRTDVGRARPGCILWARTRGDEFGEGVGAGKGIESAGAEAALGVVDKPARHHDLGGRQGRRGGEEGGDAMSACRRGSGDSGGPVVGRPATAPPRDGRCTPRKRAG